MKKATKKKAVKKVVVKEGEVDTHLEGAEVYAEEQGERFPKSGDKVIYYGDDGESFEGVITQVWTETCVNLNYRNADEEEVTVTSVPKASEETSANTWAFQA